MKHEVETLGRRVDLNLMVVFEAIYRTRNLTAAGARVGLSQPAMSHALSRLRSTFGDPLFVRVPRGVQPTPVADEVAPGVTEGLAAIRASFERKRFDPATSTRMFTIAVADIGEVVQLPPLIRAMRHAPGVRLRTISLPPPQARAALGEGQADIAISNFPVQAPLHEVVLGRPGYATLARAGHPLIRKRLTLSQFRAARHLLVRPLSAGVKHGEVVERALRSPAVQAHVAVQVGSFHPVPAILTQTDLVATIPWGLARAMARIAPLKLFKPPIDLPVTHLSLLWHDRYHRDPGNVWLRELFLQAVMPLYGARPPKATLTR